MLLEVPPGGPVGTDCCGWDDGEAEQHIIAGLSPDGGELGCAIEQHAGLGAETPAMSEPSPSF